MPRVRVALHFLPSNLPRALLKGTVKENEREVFIFTKFLGYLHKTVDIVTGLIKRRKWRKMVKRLATETFTLLCRIIKQSVTVVAVLHDADISINY